jgi:flagellar protein FlaI
VTADAPKTAKPAEKTAEKTEKRAPPAPRPAAAQPPAPQDGKPRADAQPPADATARAADAKPPAADTKPADAAARAADATPPAANAKPPAADAKPPAATPATRPTRPAQPGEQPAHGVKPVAPEADAIAQRAQEGAIRPGVMRMPFFPPASKKRPAPLVMEERRRQAIMAQEIQLRRKDLEGLDAPQRVQKIAAWGEEDRLVYRADPADEEVEIYPINEPFAYVQIVHNKRTQERAYHVIEPMLDRHEQLLLDFITETLVDVLDLDPEELDETDLERYVERKFDQVLYDYALVLTPANAPRRGQPGWTPPSPRWAKMEQDPNADVTWMPSSALEEQARARLLYYVLRNFIGEGPIDVFMRDPMIEDISCDGPHVPIYIYHRKFESIPSTVRVQPHARLDSFVIRLAQRAGKHVSIAEPILDATMRDGSRLQATLSKEVSSFGSTFTIRKFRDVPFTPIDLVRFGTMSPEILAYLWMLIQHGASAMFAGGTASGKTTATNAIMLFIPPQLKVITIEDTREINIPQENWIAGITRSGFGPHDEHGRQAGEIDMFQLLKNALRQRPEYVIVGEVRGAEAYNLFQAMATGHAAYGTMHADSVDAVIHRLESDPINIPRSLLEALDVVSVQMQTRVGGKRVRRTKQITEIVGLDANTREILTNEVFTWLPETDTFRYSGISYSMERIAVETGRTIQQVREDMRERIDIINWMIAQEILDYALIGRIIGVFYRDRERVMAPVREGKPWPK